MITAQLEPCAPCPSVYGAGWSDRSLALKYWPLDEEVGEAGPGEAKGSYEPSSVGYCRGALESNASYPSTPPPQMRLSPSLRKSATSAWRTARRLLQT